MFAKETAAKVAERVVAHNEPGRQDKPDEALGDVENHEMGLHDDE